MMSSKRKRDKLGSSSGGLRQSPLAFYTLLLLVTLVGTVSAQLILRAVLLVVGAEMLSEPINGLFAILHSWILAGLAVCALLLAWLRLTPIGIGLSIVLLVLWALGLRRHLLSPSLLLYVLPLMGGGAALWAGLRYASEQWLPVTDESQAKKAFDLLRKHILSPSHPGHVVDGVEDEYQSAFRSTGRPSSVITGCDHAIAVSDKLGLKGMRDPGLIFIGPEERIVQIIDLRPQVRTFSLTARTQDGIQVLVGTSVAFQIDAGRRKPKLGEPLPFSKAAVFKAIHAQRVERDGQGRSSEGLTPRLWDDLPSIQGEHILRDILGRFDFDDLYGPHQLDGEVPRRRIARMLSERLQATLEPMGIQLISVDLGNLEPADPQVYLKRTRNWQTEWIRRITLTQAEGQVERLQILERARADARTELILDLGRKLERLADASAELGPDTVLDQFLVVLDALMARPQLKEALPERTQKVLSDVREAVGD